MTVSPERLLLTDETAAAATCRAHPMLAHAPVCTGAGLACRAAERSQAHLSPL